MPGAFSRALKDNQYLKPLADSLLAYKQKLDEQEGRKKLLAIMDQLGNTTNHSFQIQGGGTSNVPSNIGGSNLPYNPINPAQNIQQENIPDLQNKLGTQTQGLNLNVPNQPEVSPVLPSNILPFSNRDKRPDIVKPLTPVVKQPTTFDPKNNTGDYRQATDEIRSSFADILSKAILDPTIDTAKLDQVIKLAEQKIPSAPEPNKYRYEKVNDNLVRINEKTNEVVPVYENKQGKVDKEINNYVGEDGYQYITFQKTDGTTYETKSKNKVRKTAGNNIKIDLGTKEEKWGDVSNLITELQNPNHIDQVDGKEVVTPKTSAEIKRDRDKLHNIAIGKLVPSAKMWYDKEIKGKWKRENISQEDFLAELEQAMTPDKNGKTEITPEAAQDLLDFVAFRPEIFENIDTEGYKK